MLPNVIFHTTISKMKSSEFYLFAKMGNNYAAENFISSIVKPEKIKQIVDLSSPFNAYFCPVFAIEKSGNNKIPYAYADFLAKKANSTLSLIYQNNKVFHTGQNALSRLRSKPKFIGEVIKGQNYILIDDVVTSGSTIMALKNYIEKNGGIVVAVTAIATAFSPQTGHSSILEITEETFKILQSKFKINDLYELLLQYEIIEKSIYELSNSQAKYLSIFTGIDSLRNALSNA